MRVKKKFLKAAVAFCMITLAWTGTVAQAKPVTLSFFAVGDYDGQLKAEVSAAQPGVARFAAAVKKQRQTADSLFFVSTGNLLSGTAESELTEGMALVSVFNDLRLDAMGLGTADLKWPTELLAKQAEAARYAYIGLTTVLSPENKTLSVPYKLLKRNGIKVGFLSVNKQDFADGILSADHILSGAEKVQTYITALQNEKADIIVLLTDIEAVEMIQSLLDNLTGIDLVVADTPPVFNGQIGGAVLIGAGQGGRSFSRSDVIYDKETDTITDVRTIQCDVASDGETDMAYEAFLQRLEAKVSFLKQRELGRAENELWHNPSGVSLLAQFVTDTVKTAVDAEIALLYGGEIGGGLRKGSITKGDMYRIFPETSEVVVARMNGRNLKQLLYDGLMNNTNGILMFSGVSVCYDDNKQGISKLAIMMADGLPFEEERSYRIAMSKQVLAHYQEQMEGDAIEFTGVSWRGYMEKAVRGQDIAAAEDNRLTILPYTGSY